MTEPLEQFQDWYRDHTEAAKGKIPPESLYARLRAAFYAGYAARPKPPIEPSRDALFRPRPFGKPMPNFIPAQPPPGGYPGPIPRPGEQTGWRGARQNFEAVPHKELPVREPVPADLRRIEPVAGPDITTMERIYRELSENGVVEYPSPRPEPPAEPGPRGLEHVETVWDGEMDGGRADDTMMFGALGPVRTAYELENGDNDG